MKILQSKSVWIVLSLFLSLGNCNLDLATITDSNQGTSGNTTTNTLGVPGAPTGVLASAGDAQVTLSWNPVAGATSYNIYWSNTAGLMLSYRTPVLNVSMPYAHNGLSNSLTYYYVVTAVNTAGESSASAEVGATPQSVINGTPTGICATADYSYQISICWNEAPGANSYNIYWSNSPGVSFASNKISVSATTGINWYSHIGLTGGLTYYYSVTTLNAGGESALSAEVSATTPMLPAAPTGLVATAGDGSVLLSWPTITGVSNYGIYRSMNSGFSPLSTNHIAGCHSEPGWPLSCIGGTDLSSGSYTDSGLNNGSTYYYIIVAINATGEAGAASVEVSATPMASGPALSDIYTNIITAFTNGVSSATQPSTDTSNIYSMITTMQNTDASVVITSNMIYDCSFVLLGSQGSYSFNNYTDTNGITLNGALDYYFTDSSLTSFVLTGTITASGAANESLVYNVVTNNGAMSGYTGISGYYVDYATYVTATVEPAFSLPAKPVISACTGSTPNAPTSVVVTAADSQNTVTWATVNGATSYNLYWSTTAGVSTISTKIAGVTSPYVHSLLANGTTYYYAVTAVDANGESPLSAEVSATPMPVQPQPTAPTAVAATAGNLQNTISWTPVSGATSYNIYWDYASGVSTNSNLISGVASPYVHTGLGNGTMYYYVVTAVNTSGESALSVEVSGVPNPIYTACRNYMTSYSTGGNTFICSFDSGTYVHTCTGAGNTYIYQYNSLQDFIDETQTVGRTLLSQLNITGTTNISIVYSYDISNRLTGITYSGSGMTINYSYSTFDILGRPLSGAYNSSFSGFSCTGAGISRSYDNLARTMSESISGGTGALCSNSSSTTTYDIDGNGIQVVSIPGGTTTYTINNTSQICY